MVKQLQPLGFNIGYIIRESVGYTRTHQFEFPFLDLADDLIAKDFNGTVTFSRTQRGILLDVHVEATIPTNCARCLEATLSRVVSDFTELYAFDHRTETDSELIVPESGYINLTPMVWEYLLLDTPTHPLCKPDCAGLCPVCGENRNQVDCGCETASIDPRFSALKDLLDDDNED
jgi:uncharacterized protein